ncbi:MAG: hypothetical protein K2P35_12085, partial [Lachnospiraceae bacterium]|nr:hypothetical protein [Lachnospiraceae bacterium]
GITLEIGDKMEVLGETREIVGMLKYSPFSNDRRSGGKINVISMEKPLQGLPELRIMQLSTCR